MPATLFAAETFGDVADTNIHQEAITYLVNHNIISGYKDHTFRPDHTVNRAEFVKVLVTLLDDPVDTRVCLRKPTARFSDVPRNNWFASSVCMAAKDGFISGYDDHTFRPAQTLNIAEASKILSAAFKLSPSTQDKIWYRPYINALSDAHAIPIDVEATGQSLTRGVMAEMLWRLKEHIQDHPAVDADALMAAKCNWFTDDQISHVDIQEVRRVWLGWINDARKTEGLPAYVPNKELNRTATLWSLHAKENGGISHKRTAKAAYYDYKAILKWFENYHIDFANYHSKTFTENVGWGVYQCKKDDCTSELEKAIRTTFDFYMGEKNKTSRAHYNSIMNDAFTMEGMGIAVDASSGKYYITTHYGTKITSNPDPICP